MANHVMTSVCPHHTALLIPLLGTLAAFSPLSIDRYLPSFPLLATEFGAAPGQVQMTLSAFFVGFALNQLCYGPLSDRYGRKPLLMLGLSLYVLMSLLCVVSPRLKLPSAIDGQNAIPVKLAGVYLQVMRRTSRIGRGGWDKTFDVEGWFDGRSPLMDIDRASEI
jgi:MFS family permease